jgi:hypothetical protein
MELRVTKFDDALDRKLRILAAQKSISKRKLIIELLRESVSKAK